MESVSALAEAIRERLAATAEAESRNSVTASELRQWVLEYLAEWDKEVARFPDLARESHWNLWMADYDGRKDAVFVAMRFGIREIEMVCGRGNANSVRRFCENELHRDLRQVLRELMQRFPGCQPLLAFPCELGELWIGRSIAPDSNADGV